MAKIRGIKPEFWLDDVLASVSYKARLLYIGIWNFADDNGVIEMNENKIKAQVFPYDTDPIKKELKELEKIGNLQTFEYNNKHYANISNFVIHQKIDPRFKKEIVPQKSIPERVLKCTRSVPAVDTRVPPTEVEVESEFEKNTKKTACVKNVYNENFEEFWKEYPDKRNQSKKKAKDKYLLILKAKEGMHPLIMKCLRNQVKVYDINEKGKAWQPRWKHATTWLNQEGWDMEVEVRRVEFNRKEMSKDDIGRELDEFISQKEKEFKERFKGKIKPNEEDYNRWTSEFNSLT